MVCMWCENGERLNKEGHRIQSFKWLISGYGAPHELSSSNNGAGTGQVTSTPLLAKKLIKLMGSWIK